ncbi:hillarin-like [Lineus longissimus]|uniref:hillarin-like n=1 Tax=Lineus longissimus TaxID=88925 RepID=UPI002B4FA8D5
MATMEDYYYPPNSGQVESPVVPVFFDPGTTIEKCYRCKESVYHVEKIGPINGMLWHRGCFKCSTCGRQLTVKTFYTDSSSADDKEIYCSSHAPNSHGSHVDYEAMGIKHGVGSQFRVRESKKFHNEQIRGTDPGRGAAYDTDAMTIRRALNAPKLQPGKHFYSEPGMYGNQEDVQIQGALRAQQLSRVQRQAVEKHHFPVYAQKKKEILVTAQKQLEAKHRLEEDKLFLEFQEERTEETKKVDKEVDEEWEVKLKELTKKFDKEISKKKTKKSSDDKKYMTIQFQKEKEDLEKTMTLKKTKKREYATLKLIEMEQQATSTMVKKQSKQMLGLVAAKQKELQKELEKELEKEVPADQVDGDITKEAPPVVTPKKHQQNGTNIFMPVTDDDETVAPTPKPPSCSKRELYADPAVFEELDERVFNIAENEQQTFTELVDQLTENCTSDLEKVRAIFRWITVKDLNMMDFDSKGEQQDTPLGLMRGIKFGTETYHVLFMRLCSYAGLHCVEVKGHSKSVGYEPGMKIRENTFLNTWNAVNVDGDWRMVQCNWGARHLVLNKDSNQPAQRSKKKSDKIRYQYDEHYFLTDPCDFILEFWPFESEWQCLEKPISKEQFEALPFVRSIFFHYRMQLETGTKAVVFADEKGGTQLKIRITPDLVKDIVFHYQLRFADEHRRELKEYKGTKLERFVYQTTVDNHIVFSIHLPTTGDYFLEVFANKIDDTNRISDDPNAPMMPFRLKCACKFRLICRKMVGKMHPLPNCATGEWGPLKAIRHFELQPLTHETGVVNEDNEMEIKLGVTRPLQFLAKLHCNGINEHLLDDFVELEAAEDVLTIKVKPPQPGQYGLDIFARPEGATDENVTLAHACKYLINCSHVDNPSALPTPEAPSPSKMTKDKWGPMAAFAILGLKATSHPEPRIRTTTKDPLVVEISFKFPVLLAYHLLREQDEDHHENVSIHVNEEKKVARFTITLTKPGNYLFALYAKEKKNSEKNMANIYNYMISHMTDSSHSPASSASSTNSRSQPQPQRHPSDDKKRSSEEHRRPSGDPQRRPSGDPQRRPSGEPQRRPEERKDSKQESKDSNSKSKGMFSRFSKKS